MRRGNPVSWREFKAGEGVRMVRILAWTLEHRTGTGENGYW